jgi:anti-sigma regulatory factor (Ser/Thr protein kinase)
VTRARKRAGRSRVATFGRVILAAGLLAALGGGAVQGILRASDAKVEGRRSDRLAMTEAFAASVGAFLDAGIKDASELAAVPGGVGEAAAAYARGTHTFTQPFVVDRSLHRLAGSLRYASSEGSLLACQGDDGLRRLAQAVAASGQPQVRAFDDPACTPVVAAAATVGNGPIAIVLANRAVLLQRIDAVNQLKNGRAFLLDREGDAVGTTVAPVEELKAFLTARKSKQGVDQVDAGDGSVVRAWAPSGPSGWTIVVEQGASDFTGDRATDPLSWLTAAAAACFAIAIIVIGVFDARRRRALARADVDRASFLAIVGHELRTPITVLKGFIDTLSARWDQLQDPQRQSLVERLLPQVRRLQRAVDRLLVAADIQRGANARLTSEPVNLLTSLEEVAANFRPLAPLHTFDVHVDGDPVARADRKALAQVLDQLVDNAVKYSPSGGRVLLLGRRAKGRVEVIVEDEGVGLPSDFDRIFEAFTQGEDVDRRTHDEGGVGVGLFIARTLVESMGGTVRADRRSPADGTRFVVTLRGGASTEGAPLAPSARVHGQS